MLGVFIARFVALFRTMIPGLAGMSNMPYAKFLLANAAGGIVWGITFTLLGYFIGESIEKLTGPASLVIVGAVVALGVVLYVRSWVRERGG